MEKNKKENKIILLTTLGVIGALIITLGLTYAYWRLTKEQTGVNVVNTDCFNIEFTGENDITLDKAYPLDDEELESFLAGATPYHFTITNECSSLASATINLESLNANANRQLADEWIDAILYEDDYHNKLNKSTKLIGNPNNDANKVIADALHAYSLKSFTLQANEQKDYYLLLYMDKETPLRDDTQNAHWKGKITLSAEYTFDQFANSGTLRTVSSSDETGMWQYKEQLTKIVIETEKNKKEASEGENVYGPFKESDANDKTIESYVVCDAKDINCIGYLQGDGGIILNNNSSNLFSNFTNVTKIEGLENIDTSNVTNMSHMFNGMSTLEELNISNFETGSVTTMSNMFNGLNQVQELDLSHFDTSKVTSMSNMFNGMSNLKELDLSSFNTSKVENMSYMFYGLSNLPKLEISHFNTSSATNMDAMFRKMSSLSNITLGENFKTNMVKDMSRMFSDMSKIKELDVSRFDTSKVENMRYMFSGMSQLQELDISNFDTSKVENMSYMFHNDKSLTKITYGANFIHKTDADTSYMFDGCQANKPDPSFLPSWEGISLD